MTSSERVVEKREKLNAKMSLHGGISFVLFLFLYFISFGIERTSNSRFGIRIVRKTKLKRFETVDGSDFYDVTSSNVEESDNCDGKKKRKKAFKRNKVAPAPGKAEAWSKTNGKKPSAANKYLVQESCYTDHTEIVEEDGEMTLKTSRQKWDLKTGKEIKLDKNEIEESSSSVGTDLMSSFVNVLTPPTADNFIVCNSDPYQVSSCDLFCPIDDAPGPSGVGDKNEIIMDVTGDNDWVNTGKCIKKKSALSKFLSKFRREPNTTKVRKIRL